MKLLSDDMINVFSEILDSQEGESVSVGLLDCNIVWTFRQIPTLQKNILPPSSSALKMEAVCYSEMVVFT
jgi:hypothetical protein